MNTNQIYVNINELISCSFYSSLGDPRSRLYVRSGGVRVVAERVRVRRRHRRVHVRPRRFRCRGYGYHAEPSNLGRFRCSPHDCAGYRRYSPPPPPPPPPLSPFPPPLLPHTVARV